MDVVMAAANLRAAAYGIPTLTWFDAKGMAGNIVHAVATTNAVISGLIALEAMKLLARAPSACRVRQHCQDCRIQRVHPGSDAAEMLHSRHWRPDEPHRQAADSGSGCSADLCCKREHTTAHFCSAELSQCQRHSQNTFLQQHASAGKLVQPITTWPPAASCVVCGRAQLRLSINTGTTTLGALIDKVRSGPDVIGTAGV